MKITNKLPKRLKAKWVKALRSGKYVQGTEELLKTHYDDDDDDDSSEENQDQDQYCCLGVLAKICGLADTDLRNVELPSELSPDLCNKFPPMLRQEVEDENDKPTIVGKLTKMNDSGNWSFKRIASYIERYL